MTRVLRRLLDKITTALANWLARHGVQGERNDGESDL